jgi:LPXTG-motif cell wall-anchored protein
MSSANPSATSYSIALAQLETLTTQTPGASSAPSGQSTGSNTAATTPPPASTSGSGQGSNTNETTNNNSDGLSTGAKAGIAVGIVAVVGIIGLGAFLLWRRKKNKTAANPYTPGPPAELHNTQAPVETPAAEKYARYTAEMPAPQPTYEMPGEPYRDHR